MKRNMTLPVVFVATIRNLSEAYSEYCQTSNMEPLTIFAKRCILLVPQGSGHASDYDPLILLRYYQKNQQSLEAC